MRVYCFSHPPEIKGTRGRGGLDYNGHTLRKDWEKIPLKREGKKNTLKKCFQGETLSRPPFNKAESSQFTVVVNSIERFSRDKAPIRCLPFDAIGARHPGVTSTPGSQMLSTQLILTSCNSQKPTIDSRYCRVVYDDPTGQKYKERAGSLTSSWSTYEWPRGYLRLLMGFGSASWHAGARFTTHSSFPHHVAHGNQQYVPADVK